VLLLATSRRESGLRPGEVHVSDERLYVLFDEVRAGGRINLIIGRSLTAKAREFLGLTASTTFRLPAPPTATQAGFTLAQKMVGRAVGLPDGGFVVALVVGLDALLLGVVERGEAEVVQDDEDGSATRGGASEPKVGAEMTGLLRVEGGEQQRRHLFVAAAGGVDGGLEGFRSV
jgi:hypothetical protein